MENEEIPSPMDVKSGSVVASADGPSAHPSQEIIQQSHVSLKVEGSDNMVGRETQLLKDSNSIYNQKQAKDKENLEENKRRVREALERLRKIEEAERNIKQSLKEDSLIVEELSKSDSQWTAEQSQHSEKETFMPSASIESIEVPATTLSSSSSSESLKSIAKEYDPMMVAVRSLMLIPSLSDIILSEGPVERRRTASIRRSKRIDSDAGVQEEHTLAEEFVPEEGSNEGESGESRSDEAMGAAIDQDDESFISFASDIEEVNYHAVVFDDEVKHNEDEFADFMAYADQTTTTDIGPLPTQPITMEVDIIVADFIKSLISNVINFFERRDPDAEKRKKLDKQKLMAGLETEVVEYLSLMDTNNVLNERLVDYYRHAKIKRNFFELPAAEEESCKTRYQIALAQLSHGLEHVKQVKLLVAFQANKAILELQNAQSIVSGTEVHLERTIRQLIVRPDSETDFLKRMVARELRLMSVYRNDISDTRLILITQKHTLARTEEKTKKLETVSENISMNDFINTQARVVSLEKKLEERNLELKRCHVHYQTELHLIKHSREKILGLKNRLQVLKAKLNDSILKRSDLKEQLYQEKLIRHNIRRATNELTYQGGILVMPSLMYDYDRTVVFIAEKEEHVTMLREQFRTLLTLIRGIENEERD